MKKFYNPAIWGVTVLLSVGTAACSDNDEPNNGNPENFITKTIGFTEAPNNIFASSTYGENLYNGQISKGYIVPISNKVYAQFPINYGYNYDADFNLTWCYTYFNGGFALSDYHNMTGDTYQNQMSVYNTTSPSGGNFIVANGSSSITDPSKATYADYDGCAKVYLTDKNGFGVAKPGEEAVVTGEDESGWFRSVWLTNTTYTYLTMKNGNDYCSPLNEENKGWFKVQFIAFDDTDANDKPLKWVEAYLANFDESLNIGYTGIIEEWIKVDLTSLPECEVLVVNFVGSDMGEYGLNTPAYCALDNFEITVEKD